MTRKLLFLVNVDWFFISHRLPIALAAISEGYEVHLACRFTNQTEYLLSKGFTLHALPLSRSGKGIFSELRALSSIYKILKDVRPQVVHSITIKPVLYGGIAARLIGVEKRVSSISGLGHVFIAGGIKAAILRNFVFRLYRLALNGPCSKVIFQNDDDKNLLLKHGVVMPSQIEMIRGSGVDLAEYFFRPEPQGIPKVILVARILYDKGVAEFVEAAHLLKMAGIRLKMILVGDIDLGNPNSATDEDIVLWGKTGYVECLGYQESVAEIMADSNLVVLPSYREGFPKSLIEAAACGRAVVTTDVPGCRDAIVPNETGLLVPPKNAQALAEAITFLLENRELRQTMGQAGRLLAEQSYGIDYVVDRHLEIYKSSEKSA